jgi:hypothetical protein
MDSRQKIAKPVRLENNRLDEAHIATLFKQGFSSFENVASAAEVSEIRSICAKLIFERTGADEGAFFDFVGDAPLETKGLTQLLMPSDYDPKLRRMDYQKRLNALAKQILGPRARFAGDHLFYKPPVAGPSTPWHQDEAFLDPKFEYEEVSFWLPLQPATVENGCLRFIPGSHLTDIQPHRKIQGKERAHGIECYTGFSADDAVLCPIPVGGCTLHLGRTLHGAGPNSTEMARFAYVVIFDVPAKVARVKRSFDWQKQSTVRDETERIWKQGSGRLVHLYRRLRRQNFTDPYRVYNGLKRRGLVLMERFIRLR